METYHEMMERHNLERENYGKFLLEANKNGTIILTIGKTKRKHIQFRMYDGRGEDLGHRFEELKEGEKIQLNFENIM